MAEAYDNVDRLLYVTSDPGENDLKDFHDWYDNEHVANRLPFEGLSNAVRWRAVDHEPPEWLATYDVTQDLLDDPEYQQLRSNRSPRERAVIAGLDDFTRSTYALKSSAAADLDDRERAADSHLLSVRLHTEPKRCQEIINWYVGEHMPRLLSIGGWLRIRVFVPTDCTGGLTHVLALHDLSSLSGFDSEEYRSATSTAWRGEVMAHVRSKDRRLYALYRRF